VETFLYVSENWTLKPNLQPLKWHS